MWKLIEYLPEIKKNVDKYTDTDIESHSSEEIKKSEGPSEDNSGEEKETEIKTSHTDDVLDGGGDGNSVDDDLPF